jgi:hypothetical protein
MRDLEQEFGQAMADVRQTLSSNGSRKAFKMRKVVESVRYMENLRQDGTLDERDDEWVQSWIERGRHSLDRSLERNIILTLSYYKDNLEENPDAHYPPQAAILALKEVEDLTSPKSTRWKTYLQSFGKLEGQIKKILGGDEPPGGTLGTWYVLFNTLEVLATIDRKEDFQSHLDSFNTLVEEYEDELREEMEWHQGLKSYAHDLSQRGIFPLKIDEPVEDRNLSDKGRLFKILNRLSRGEPVDYTIVPEHPPKHKEHLWGITRAWVRSKNGDSNGILPFYENVDVDEVFRRTWNIDRQSLNQTSITPEDYEIVQQMSDEQIQDTLVKLFEGNSYVTEISRATLRAERNKAHTGIEISDFDIEVKMKDSRRFANSERTVQVCLPIKSAQEAGSASVEKLSETNIHQIIRPFDRFGIKTTVVFPILITGWSVNANEYLKTWRSNLNLPIVPIDCDTFANISSHNELI